MRPPFLFAYSYNILIIIEYINASLEYTTQDKKILMDISNNMDNNSTIYILEPFTDKQKFKAAKSSLIHISLYFTCMANGVSKMYTQEEFLELIAQCNLKIKEIHNDIGAFDYTLLECGK